MPTQILQIEEITTGKDCVLAYGHFNTIHPGHIRYLRHARVLAKKMVVALIGDWKKTDYRFKQKEERKLLASWE